MGFVLSKFRKTKPSIKDSLEKIEKEIRGIHRFQIDTEVQQKRIIGRLVLSSMVLFCIGALAFYIFAPPNLSAKDKLMYLAPFVIFPVLIYSLKGLLNWWYQRKIVMNREKLDVLKKQKDQLLEDVMEKETFKVAKEILEKYAPSRLLPKYLAEQQRSSPQGPGMNTPLTSRSASRMSTGGVGLNEGLRRRNERQSVTMGMLPQGGLAPGQRFPMGPPGPQGPGPFPRPAFRPPAIMGGPSSAGLRSPAFSSVPTGFTPMRHIMPSVPINPVTVNRKTGWLDKLVDYVVGDGPANRYALVCRYCATHNGLATPEDFPFIGYRCVFCRQFNPPRQQRPSAQTLPRNTVLIEEMETSMKSEEDGGVLNETEEGEKNEGAEGENKESEETTGTEKTENEDANNAREPVVDLASSTSDLSRRSDSEHEKEDDSNIPYADENDQDQVQDSGSKSGGNSKDEPGRDGCEEVLEESLETRGGGDNPKIASDSDS